ncbi:hypothetical protein PanWU01x14_131860 [Parasponia andersonii]|uniref:RCD1 WWE domain-containing protein n=1 Tax=Parasponia andersonii TaxID=3476 RepID=A0A2P5CQK0_PARAD|nr:hypothetical protein PanWU01x14_131860 [Parasponia andersonii]
MSYSNKQMESEGCNSHNKGTHFRRSSLKHYSNFKKSGLPQRLIFYHDNEWTDFPGDLFDIMRLDLKELKETIDVKLNGKHYLLDFRHMFSLDNETRFEQSITVTTRNLKP